MCAQSQRQNRAGSDQNAIAGLGRASERITSTALGTVIVTSSAAIPPAFDRLCQRQSLFNRSGLSTGSNPVSLIRRNTSVFFIVLPHSRLENLRSSGRNYHRSLREQSLDKSYFSLTLITKYTKVLPSGTRSW